MIALDGPLRMLADPPRHVGLGSHDALLQRSLPGKLQVLVLASVRLRDRADQHHDFDKAGHGRTLMQSVGREVYTRFGQLWFPIKSSPFPSTAMSPAKRRSGPCRRAAAR